MNFDTSQLQRQFEALLGGQIRHNLPSSATNSPTLTGQSLSPKNPLADGVLLPSPITGSPASSKAHREPEVQLHPEAGHFELKPESPVGPSWSPNSDENQKEGWGKGPRDQTEGTQESLPESEDVEVDPGLDGSGPGLGDEREDCDVESPVSPSPAPGKLSLFSGMELVNTPRPPSQFPEPASVDTELSVASTTNSASIETEEAELVIESELISPLHSDSDRDSSFTQASSDLGQQDSLQVSAFSFLNV